MEKIKNFINGKWIGAKSGKTFQSINPANQDDVILRNRNLNVSNLF